MSQPELHSSIVALISLASGIAAKHPDMGLCQLDRLRSQGVPENQIQAAIEIARHIRDEAAQKLDAAFDQKANRPEISPEQTPGESCCTPTASGQSCC
ncbi:MAG TPA: hypothetical protein ENK06_02345 [Gammaproteobacteria bacterium]|nr:hypothetical protein [Gammaproteobacteria bacterium]